MNEQFQPENIAKLSDHIKFAGAKLTPADFAEAYLHERGLKEGGRLKLRLWKDDYYSFDGKCFVPLPKSEMKTDVVRWLQKSSFLDEAVNAYVNNILLNIDATCSLSHRVELQSMLSEPAKYSPNLVNFRNGILDINAYISNGDITLADHTPLFFSSNCLPYDFDPTAQCPLWLTFLREIQPDESVRSLIQEWFGYNLTYDVSQQRFMLFVGDGANGKTVACVVLRALIGDKNVSAVGLEAFSPTRTFPLAGTIGKLANIVAELSEIDKAAEGELKKFVSGELMTVERKHQHPFECRPTARLTFASNVLPRFADRSDGLWRRLLIVPFSVQILNEDKQDKRLVDPTFWTESGELPGILNWALQGLIRLREQKSFNEPEVCKLAKASYKKDSNPAKAFLQEYCLEDSSQQVSSKALYLAYSNHIKDHGHAPLSEAHFGQEVRRVFKKAEKSPNAVRVIEGRSHVWYGLRLI